MVPVSSKERKKLKSLILKEKRRKQSFNRDQWFLCRFRDPAGKRALESGMSDPRPRPALF